MKKEKKSLSYLPIIWVRRIFLAIIVLTVFVFLYFIFSQIGAYFSQGSHAISSYEHYSREREFLTRFVLDPEEGGFYYWVDKDGLVQDDRKYSLFQSNIILWFGGLQSQHPDPKNIKMIENAADYLVDHLYKGNGEWFEYDTRNHRGVLDFFWNPRSESYISFALLQAYRLTDNERYLKAATETNAVQRRKWPEGRIYSLVNPSQEIGQRFPEHMGQYEEYLLTGNQDAIDYVRLYDETHRGTYGKEILSQEADIFYSHGMAVVDKLLYGYQDKNGAAYNEGSEGRNTYWSMRHDDAKSFNPEIPGESSDNGRDYYDKRLAMDLIEWSKRGVEVYQDDAVDMWNEVKRFWDDKFPYGFEVNTIDNRKTCFSIGVSQYLMDLLGPEVVTYQNETKGLFNHQLKITFVDPDYTWNDITLRGIGVAKSELKSKIPLGSVYGKVKMTKGPCEDCVSYELNYFSLLPFKASFGTRDLFGNIELNEIDNPFNPFANLSNLNAKSIVYYGFVLISILAILFIAYTIIFFIVYRNGGVVDVELTNPFKRRAMVDDDNSVTKKR